MSLRMPLPVTGAVAGTLGVFCSGLALRIGFRRFFSGVHYGVGKSSPQDTTSWERVVRAQQNATEHVPLFLILLGALELNKIVETNVLVGLGTAFAAARVAHSLQLADPEVVPLQLRIAGFFVQVGTTVAASALLIAKCCKKINQA